MRVSSPEKCQIRSAGIGRGDLAGRITRLRGRDFEYKCAANGKSYPVAVIYHPSYLLRQPAQKRLAWQDMLAIKARMNAVG